MVHDILSWTISYSVSSVSFLILASWISVYLPIPNTEPKNVRNSPNAVNTVPEISPCGGTKKPAIVRNNPTMNAAIAADHTIISRILLLLIFPSLCVTYIYCAASTTVQPDGIPFTPVVQSLIEAVFVNVPEAATLSNHSEVQSVADISVARHLIEVRFSHP